MSISHPLLRRFRRAAVTRLSMAGALCAEASTGGFCSRAFVAGLCAGGCYLPYLVTEASVVDRK